jgi:hypothetical protein
MKMVKSLLLGSAAGLVAVTSGQAADLPVKARPVEYVKICSLYGAGFYYMPGTDLCLKVGGWVRAEATYGDENGNITWGPYNANAMNRSTSNLVFRARGYITADARDQTEYGTIRSYIAVGLSTSDTGLQVASLVDSVNRAFVQFGGMTAGLAQSFFDFYSVPAAQYRGGYLPASDTGDGGWWVWAYTAQFGGGFSATISAEARRTTQIIDQNALPGFTLGTGAGIQTVVAIGQPFGNGGSVAPGSYPCVATYTAPTNVGSTNESSAAVGGCSSLFPGNGAYGGQQMPDIVGNFRVDQAWGSAQVMGALHQVNPVNYSQAVTAAAVAAAGQAALGPLDTLGQAPCVPGGGHPEDTFGWAVGGGIKILTPQIGQGDYFQAQVNYTEGALRYLFNTPNTNYGKVDGAFEAFGVLSDCVYGGTLLAGTATSCHLTTAWGFNASYEHYWNPQWHTSLYGAYYAVSYDKGLGSANAMLCAATGHGNFVNATNGTPAFVNPVTGAAVAATAPVVLPGFGRLALEAPGCNMDWSTWGVGTRTQWDVTKTFYLGVEVLYENLHSAQTGNGFVVNNPPGAPGIPFCSVAAIPLVRGSATGSGCATFAFGNAIFNEANSGAWTFTVRAHRDFLP